MILKHHITTKNLENGRSMVEMLGVLAVIGVLSIGALQGYSYGISKYLANETVNDVSLYAMSASQQVLAGHEELNFSELGNVSSAGYPIDGDILEEDPDYFQIYVDKVPTDVCKRIVEMGWRQPTGIFVSNAGDVYSLYGRDSAICDSDENVNMAFQFYSDFSQKASVSIECGDSEDCPNCFVCEENQCVSRCATNQLCLENSSSKGDMICCDPENKSGPYCCASTRNGWCCSDAGQENCCPWDKPLKGSDGNCYSCDYASVVKVEGMEDNCNVCSNREVLGAGNGVLLDRNSPGCVLKCPENKPFRDRDGNCFGCEDASHAMLNTTLATDCVNKCTAQGYARTAVRSYCAPGCAEGEAQDTYGKCFTCEKLFYTETDGVDHSNDCTKCGSGYTLYSDSKVCVRNCDEPNQFRDATGECRNCDDNTVYRMGGMVGDGVNSYCRQACPERVAVPFYASNDDYTYYCAKKCDNGQYMGHDGTCNDCETGANKKATKSECGKCSNREWINLSSNANNTNTGWCNLPCDTGKFRGADGVCYSCTQDEPIRIIRDSSECADKCPNREINGIGDTYGSVVQYCSKKCEDGEFADNLGNCHSCDEDKHIIFNDMTYAQEQCRKCGDTRNLYYTNWYKGKWLCAPKCPAETPLIDENGNCFACDYPDKVSILIEDRDTTDGGRLPFHDICTRECFAERKIEGNYCVLK